MSMFSFLNDIDNYDERRVARDSACGLTVSTANTSDEGFETAILDTKGAHPVERYDDRPAAIAGHALWVEKCRRGLNRITELGGLGGLVDDQAVTLEPENHEEGKS